jgi:hypothetical protein
MVARRSPPLLESAIVVAPDHASLAAAVEVAGDKAKLESNKMEPRLLRISVQERADSSAPRPVVASPRVSSLPPSNC